MLIKRSLLLLTSAIGFGLAVAGCGGSADGVIGATNPTATAQNGAGGTTGSNGQTATALDAFVSRVLALLNDCNDGAEPVNIDDVVATTPENTEPASL